MRPEDIQEKLRLHRLWIDVEDGGVRADFSNADLSAADLTGADLFRANLFRANLTGAKLTGAKLTGAKLTEADLFRANLSRADLGKADLSGADLFRADLRGANLTGATGNGKEVKSAQVHSYILVWHRDALWIGCQRKTLDEWELFDPREEGMSEEDCDAWEAHKDWIFETVRRFPAE